MLDGGINEFIKIGGEVSNEVPVITKGSLNININEYMKVDMEYVRNSINKDNIAIIDSRENVRYIGEFEPVDEKCGHIPSALNFFWMDILDQSEGKIRFKE